MATWHLIYPRDHRPISVARADGVAEPPPDGLMRYVELARGPWTLEAPVGDPAGTEAVDWPRACVLRTITRCGGLMDYLARVPKPIVMAGERVHPHGWVCAVCGCQEVGGLGAHLV
jgi:hypothetical protein